MNDSILYTISDPMIWSLILLIILSCVGVVIFHKKIPDKSLRNMSIFITLFGMIVFIFDLVSIIQTYKMVFK